MAVLDDFLDANTSAYLAERNLLSDAVPADTPPQRLLFPLPQARQSRVGISGIWASPPRKAPQRMEAMFGRDEVPSVLKQLHPLLTMPHDATMVVTSFLVELFNVLVTPMVPDTSRMGATSPSRPSTEGGHVVTVNKAQDAVQATLGGGSVANRCLALGAKVLQL